MARKKSSSIFDETDCEKQAISYLRGRGYGVFKLDDDLTDVEEAEAVKRLQAIGYKVEHIETSLVKVDTRQIASVDDLAVYFHEMLKRHSKMYYDRKKLTDKSSRAVDRSVFNHFLNWRIVDAGLSLQEALSELFIMIDVLFEKASEWGVEVRSSGIFSVVSNKHFVLRLLREAKLRQDAQLSFKVDRMIKNENNRNYLDLLESSRKKLETAQEPPKAKRRKIKR